MDQFMQSVSELWQQFSTDEAAQVKAALGGILLALWTLAVKPKRRVKVTVDAPPGEKVVVRLGEDDEANS